METLATTPSDPRKRSIRFRFDSPFSSLSIPARSRFSETNTDQAWPAPQSMSTLSMSLKAALWRERVPKDFVAATVIHVLVFAFSVALLVLRAQLVASPWLSLVDNTTLIENTNRFQYGIVSMGALSLAGTLTGAVITWRRAKLPLAGYAMVIILMAAAAILLTVWCSQVRGVATEWRERDFLAKWDVDQDEPVVAKQFNSLYCHAQRAYLCDRASLNQLLAIPFEDMATHDSHEHAIGPDVLQACRDRYGADISVTSAAWTQVCAFCVRSEPVSGQQEIVDWVLQRMAFNATTVAWCASSTTLSAEIKSGNAATVTSTVNHTIEFKDSPYVVYRSDLLQMAHRWSERAFVSFLVECGLLLVLLALVCSMLHTAVNREALAYDEVDEDLAAIYAKA